MANKEDDYLLISGLQNYVYCRRRWALVHIEQMWNETSLTMEGHYMHERVHDSTLHEKRGRFVLSRGIRVVSHSLQVTGVCDLVELEEDNNGVEIVGRSGKYRVFPIEYKHGKPDEGGADEVQLCAQAMCLEEMLCTDIAEGAIYYGQLKRREVVQLSEKWRAKVKGYLNEMHQYMSRQYTPNVKRKGACTSCSMKDLCNPNILKNSAKEYIKKRLREDCDA